jgi:DNA invertase Pin-like site-specific DNA recombinase
MGRSKAFSYIRFSTPEQSKGRSLERQMEAARTYAVSKNLELDESLTFKDLGVSAYRGRNIEEGALGAFLEAVKEGRVARGSYLLVESLDRISRQAARRAANTIGEIVDAGITVVDLSDNEREYSADALDKDGMNFLMMVVRFMRANEESQRKSERLADAWKKKRDKANNNVPMTSMAPAWLKLSPDKQRYVVIKDRELTIKRIFELAASGMGMYAITKRLNEKKVPHFGKSSGWRLPYVAIILRNRAVLGEFQPHKYVDGKRVPVDENGNPLPKGTWKTIPGYYPKIVDEEIFDRVHRGLTERQFAGAGRKGKGYTSLFSGLLKCGRCGSSVYLENKGRNERYLVCAGAGPHAKCQTLRWRYDHFEHSVLHFLSKQIDLQSIVSSNREQDKRYQLDAKIEALEGSKIALEKQFEARLNIADTITDANANQRLSKMLDAIGKELADTDAQLEMLTKERDILINEAKAMSDADIKALIESLNTVSDEDRYKARSDLASGFRKFVSRIDINFGISEEGLMEQYADDLKDTEEEIEVSVEQPNFAVTFKNGQEARCFPSADDASDQIAMIGRENVEYMKSLEHDFKDPDKAFEEWLAKKGYDVTDLDKAIVQATKDMDAGKSLWREKPKKKRRVRTGE